MVFLFFGKGLINGGDKVELQTFDEILNTCDKRQQKKNEVLALLTKEYGIDIFFISLYV